MVRRTGPRGRGNRPGRRSRDRATAPWTPLPTRTGVPRRNAPRDRVRRVTPRRILQSTQVGKERAVGERGGRTRVLIADRLRAVREGLSALLGAQDDFEVV